jgi:hypothetical protein
VQVDAEVEQQRDAIQIADQIAASRAPITCALRWKTPRSSASITMARRPNTTHAIGQPSAIKV